MSEDVWMVDDDEACFFNTGLTKDNVDHFIIDAASQFIKLTEIKLPERFFHLGACQQCHFVGEQRQERIDLTWMPEWLYRFIFRRGPTWRAICGQCGQPYPLGMGDYAGRELYLHSIGENSTKK